MMVNPLSGICGRTIQKTLHGATAGPISIHGVLLEKEGTGKLVLLDLFRKGKNAGLAGTQKRSYSPFLVIIWSARSM